MIYCSVLYIYNEILILEVVVPVIHICEYSAVPLHLITQIWINTSQMFFIMEFYKGIMAIFPQFLVFSVLFICILNTYKKILWQMLKTLMKCCELQHFIRVC